MPVQSTKYTAETKVNGLPEIECSYSLSINFGPDSGPVKVSKYVQKIYDMQEEAIREMIPRLNSVMEDEIRMQRGLPARLPVPREDTVPNSWI